MNLFRQPTSLNQPEHWSKALLARIQIIPAVIKSTSLNHTDAQVVSSQKKREEKTVTVWPLGKQFSGEGTGALLHWEEDTMVLVSIPLRCSLLVCKSD